MSLAQPGTPGRAPILPPPPAIRGVVFIAKERCKGCELCIEFCPTRVLSRSDDFNAKGYHYPVVSNGTCINCRLCLTVCPEYAIFATAAPAGVRPRAAAASPGGGA
jgi:2-oxoglutarate ferredoxin oxidoreductase subunit delta